MDQNYEIYERIIDLIIKNNRNSLQKILSLLRDFKLFEDDFLLQIISYLKMAKLIKINCKDFPDFKYYILKIGESNFIFNEGSYCTCNDKLDDKIKYKNICQHLLTFKILLEINNYKKIYFNKDQMIELMNDNKLI